MFSFGQLLLGLGTSILLSLALPWILVFLYTVWARQQGVNGREKLLAELGQPPDRRVVGYFHPYCNAGGGGERVLWTAIVRSQRNEPNVVSVVYSGDIDASKEEIIAKVKLRFDIVLDPSSLHFVFLEKRWLVEDATWPAFTLLGQSIGSMILTWEAITNVVPHLFIDTMGYAFSFPVVSLIASVPTGAYVHYPTISTQMLKRVTNRQSGVTNRNFISQSIVLTYGKLLYYRIFMFYYSRALRMASFKMANSSWTKNHVDAILVHRDPLLEFANTFSLARFLFAGPPASAHKQSAQIVYPSCDTRAMSSFPLTPREPVVLSVAQFRPEKNHAAQLQALAALLKQHPSTPAKFVLLGGARNDDDLQRVDTLRLLARNLGVEDHVEFVVNASYAEVLEWLAKSSVGLSTMVDEHFGINVVELMAAGVIPVSHASGGPLHDIIVSFEGKPTGYHARTPEEFADAIHIALTLPEDEAQEMRQRARTWAVQAFSEDEFERTWNTSGWRDVLEEGYTQSQ
ncbi:glycosyltransferase family 4 protein [Cylindrobasidium torrendii FP15055 ss-10]|uniref:GDP-Man:Man(3)GlcNAc(2)-PP-Dol alpha-1,2-mannosyltransferase n=1 Tax=Cylindrobasidium torrendii FP15055 ss-10 TaxID=1314674 RepID=A0A0D7BIP7_9AGAR|nr:glycosyltransferase family 4 protein [Cylindrobasidium torrendii FP15055 ss-10]